MRLWMMILGLIIICGLGADNVLFVNTMSQTLSCYNTQTEEVDNEICNLGLTAGAAPNKVAYYENLAYVVITNENAVQKINVETGTSLGYIYLENSSTPNDICIVDGFAYVTGNISYKLYKIDLATEEVVADLEVGKAPEGVFLVNDEIWVANTGYDIAGYYFEPGTVSVVDPQEMIIIRTIQTEINPRNGMLINGKVHLACTGNYVDEAGTVNIINIDGSEPETVLELGGTPASVGNSGDRVYIGHSYPAALHVYDVSSYEILEAPEDGTFTGGTEFCFDNENIYIIDPGDYIYPSWCRIYSLDDYVLINEFEVGVGATDIIIMPEFTTAHNEEVPAGISAYNYPNPFNPSTTISFSIEQNQQNEQVELMIYNIKGQKVKDLSSSLCHPAAAGRGGMNYSITWNGTDENNKPVSSGIYFYKLKAGKYVSTKKMILLK